MAEQVNNPHLAIGDEEIFDAHLGGKLSVELKSPLDTQRALSIAYTPGVAQVSRAIAADATLVKRYTWASRLVAVVSDGSAVLGLGDIGPAASLPVMEGKSALFKTFGGLDSIPGTIVGGLTIGLLKQYVSGYADPGLAEVIPYVVLVAILMVRPYGIFGETRIERV